MRGGTLLRMRPLGLLVLVLIGCQQTQPAAPAAGPGSSATSGPAPSGQQKTITVGISTDVQGFSLLAGDSTAGGWQSAQEIVSDGLITADHDSRSPVGRLAAGVPTFDDGSMSILPDGRMQTTYTLRPNVTWHDGAPFTSADMMFSFELAMDPTVPKPALGTINQMDSAEAPDDLTFVIYWKHPYYLADAVGLRAFWPLPQHLLEQPYQTLDRQAFTNLPYWSTDFVHLGPFKVQDFRPGDAIVTSAYDGYYLGRPKVDQVILRIFGDQNALLASTLAGTIDVNLDTSLSAVRGLQLADQWAASGDGMVYLVPGTTRFIAPQFDPDLQHVAALFDPRVRTALQYAIDRSALSGVVQHGHTELWASALVPPGDRMYDAVKDGLAQFSYDPTQARAILADAGYEPGADGMLVGKDGTPLSIPIWVTVGSEDEIATIADYWKQIGVASEQDIIPGALVLDRQFRQAYSGVEVSAAGGGDSILIRVDSRESTNPPAYFGNNRGHYNDPQLDQLIDAYRSSVNLTDQGQAMKGLSDYFASELPVLPLYFGASTLPVRAGVKAMDDYRGGADGAQLYGTFTRDAYQWDLS